MKRIASLLIVSSSLLLLLASSGGGSSDDSEAAAAGGGFKPEAVQLPSDEALRDEIDEVLKFTGGRYMDAQQHAAWQIVHGIVAFGPGLQIYNNGELVPALEWILAGGTLRGWNLQEGSHGLKAVLESGSRSGQGHPDQWLGYLSLCGLEPDHPIIVQGRTYTLFDLVTQAQADIYDGMEASWTLMGLSTYLPLDATWTAADGSEWDLERIVAMEAAQDINESACGGTHRLSGLSVALNRYLAEGGELTGGWLEAEEVIRKAVETAKRYQQPDGAFSTSYFERPGNAPDLALRMGTTGHTLEFLCYALNDEELAEEWVKASVTQLCKIFRQTRDLPIECGALYHAARGLQLYRLRRFGEPAFASDYAATVEAGEEAVPETPPLSGIPAADPPVESIAR